MKVLISGATGLVGSEFSSVLKADGHDVVRLTRAQPKQGEISWDPLNGKIDSAALNSQKIDAVVHLAGETIVGNWTPAKKKLIRDSRVIGTTTLCQALAKMSSPPRVLISASAIGYYGLRGDELLTEKSAPGTGFLSEVCKEWEASTSAASQAGIRTIIGRIGMVLSPKGGGLSKMLLPFKMCAGGIIASGKQYMSCISLPDLVGAMYFAMKKDGLNGPVNLVMPEASTNYEFTKTLGKVLSRPTIFPMPAFAARLAFGEMADDLLIGSTRVKPERLIAEKYVYQHPNLEAALRGVLGK